MNINMKTTNRGFAVGDFTDKYGLKCSLQESSAADKPCIWLGVNEAIPIVTTSEAVGFGYDLDNTDSTGWVKVPIPDCAIISSRMHLTQEDVKRLLPSLINFVETGYLPLGKDDE